MAADQRILYEIKPFCLVVLSIFLATETKSGIQNLLTDTEAGWSDLQKLIGINELQSLFQAQLLWWYKLLGIICRRRSCVGEMLCLADV